MSCARQRSVTSSVNSQGVEGLPAPPHLGIVAVPTHGSTAAGSGWCLSQCPGQRLTPWGTCSSDNRTTGVSDDGVYELMIMYSTANSFKATDRADDWADAAGRSDADFPTALLKSAAVCQLSTGAAGAAGQRCALQEAGGPKLRTPSTASTRMFWK